MPCLLAWAEVSCLCWSALSPAAPKAPETRSVSESLPGTLPLAFCLLASLLASAVLPWTDSETSVEGYNVSSLRERCDVFHLGAMGNLQLAAFLAELVIWPTMPSLGLSMLGADMMVLV